MTRRPARGFTLLELAVATALLGVISVLMLGVLVPLVLEKLDVDPAVATSPFVTTMNDLLGATIIILLAALLVASLAARRAQITQ